MSSAGRGGSSGGSESGSAGSGGSALGGSAGSASAGRGGSTSCEPEAERCDGLDNDCDGEIDDGAACPEGCEGHAIAERGYVFCVDVEATFRAANAACDDLDMHLAWIQSAEENSAIVSAAQKLGVASERLWLGAADREEGDWRWVDAEGNPHTAFWSGDLPEDGGKPVGDQYVNWGEDRPNDSSADEAEDCLDLSLSRSGLDVGTWNDDECMGTWPFVCEAD